MMPRDIHPADHPALALWCDPRAGLVARIAREIAARGLHPARTVVLVPYAQLMGVAREMWARCGPPGFMPRFETTRSWARGAGGFVPGEDDIAFDTGCDLVTAQSLLARAGMASLRVAMAPRLVEVALQLAPLAAACPPGERPGWAQRLRGLLAPGGGGPWFGVESALHAIALAWAANSAYATDVLLQGAACRQADALIVLEGLQPDPLAQRLAALFGDAAQRLSLRPPRAVPAAEAFALHEALDPEDEAERATACVLRHLAQGRAPVALVATDRALTRRIGAQLATQGVALADETGWKLSTTRCAATLMSALRAAMHDAGSDAVLDWLKNAPAFDARLTQALERHLRAGGHRGWAGWLAHTAAAEALRDELRDFTHTVEALRATLASARPLARWLDALRDLLRAGGQWDGLEADQAGARVIAALHLDGAPAWADGARWSLTDFTGWVRDVLEAASVSLTPADGAAARVVVLPLPQLLGRVFAAAVIPGCDDQRLPASPELPGDWSTAQREALGLPLRAALEAAQRAAWAVALQAPQGDLLWRQFDAAGEPVRPSMLLQLLRLDGVSRMADDPRETEVLALQPVAPPRPVGAALPLAQLSASAYEDLRRCPYRFFALRQLGLRGADELDAEISKRDFGNWLHAVLHHFHEALRDAPTTDAARRLALMADAQARATREAGLSVDEFVPFAAAWPAVRDGYLDWLARHEAREGAQFAESEAERRVQLGTVALLGRIDRIDRTPEGQAFVIDYKTESLDTTRRRVKAPAEDTQLAFYAALLEDDTLRAAYVNVGEKSSGTHTVEQQEVVAARDALVHGIMHDLQRIAAGTPLPALGEGAVCEHCEARGLCRKDFWA